MVVVVEELEGRKGRKIRAVTRLRVLHHIVEKKTDLGHFLHISLGHSGMEPSPLSRTVPFLNTMPPNEYSQVLNDGFMEVADL